MGARTRSAVEPEHGRRRGTGRGVGRLRLVPPLDRTGKGVSREGADLDETPDQALGDEAGTTTAEYTVVTGAAVAFGALLFKLLTSEWGDRILSTAFRHVISLLGA